MKKRMQGMVAGLLVGVVLTSGVAGAKSGTEMIEAAYNNIKIFVEGVKIEPKDAMGNSVEPFIYNGTTYLPVRAVGEAIGKTVSWDGTTQSVYLGEKPGDAQYMVEVCPPYNGDEYRTYTSSKGESLLLGGKKYTNGIKLGYKKGFALVSLDGKYDSMTFVMGRADEDNIKDTTVNFFVDDALVESIDVSGEALPRTYTVNLRKGLQLKIATEEEDIALMDIVMHR